MNDRIHPAEIAALIAILVLAGVLRLGWPGVNSFAYDEARLSRIALDMARGGEFAALGMPSSAGPPNPPAAAWIYALPYAISTDPLFATLFTGLLSVASVGGTWALARAAWGRDPALLAALVLATSPYAVLYGRSIWAQNLLPVLGLLWGISAYYADERRFALAVHAFIAGFAFQVHIAGIGLLPGTLILLVWRGWWRRPVPLLLGGGLAALALLPFVNHVLCCAPEVIDGYLSAGAEGGRFSLTGLTETVRLALAREWGFLAAGGVYPLFEVGALLLLYLAGVIGLIRALRAGDRLAQIVIVWLLTTPLTFFFLTTPLLIHYLLAGLPALALLAGRALPTLPRLVALILALAAAFGTTFQVAQSLALAAEEVTPGGLGTPLAITRGVAEAVPDDLPVLFFTHGDDITRDGEAAVFDTLWWGRPHRIIDGRSLLVLPPEPAYLLATLAPFQAWEELRDADLITAETVYPRRAGAGPGFVGAIYDGETDPAGFTMLAEPVPFEHGVILEGWRARLVGPRLRISTLWRVIDPPPDGTIQQFHHLRDESTLTGEPLAIADVPAHTHDWQPGDRLIIMADFFDTSGGSYWVDVGQYRFADAERLRHAGGDSVRLGPFTVGN